MEVLRPVSDLGMYSWPGVITFLQDQSMLVEEEKTIWLIERKQLDNRIILLESEVKAYASSNDDLTRRVKMLELTLRQERIKYAKFSGGHHRVNSDLIAGILNKGDGSDDNKHLIPKRRTRIHRQLLEKYLQELGFEGIFADDSSDKPTGAHHRSSKSYGPAVITKSQEVKPVPLQPALGLPPKPEPRTEKPETPEQRKPEIVVPPLKAEESKVSKSWLCKSVFKSHVDIVRGLHFTQREEILATASEDNTLKLWDVSGLSKFTESLAHEPYFTLRGHKGPVLAMTGCAIGADQLLFSAGSDGAIKVWQIKGPGEVDIYGEYPERGLNVGSWSSHTEAIWSLAHHATQQLLLSASADGVVKLWSSLSAETSLEYLVSGRTSPNLLKNFTLPSSESLHIPTSTVWTSDQKFAVGYTTCQIGMFDAESIQSSSMAYSGEAENSQTNAIVVNNETLITGHEDRHLRVFDLRTSSCVKEIVGHSDAVSCLTTRRDTQIITGSHDGGLRFWDMRKFQCYHEVPAHRKKYDEAVTALAYCPSTGAVVSGGADSVVKLFLCIDE